MRYSTLVVAGTMEFVSAECRVCRVYAQFRYDLALDTVELGGATQVEKSPDGSGRCLSEKSIFPVISAHFPPLSL